MNISDTRKNNGIIRTPLLPFYSEQHQVKAAIYLKPENLQAFGSYKIRGIDAVFKNTPVTQIKHGVAAASAGNMGQAIAFMARKINIPCTIYVPDSTPAIKKDRIHNLGAKLVELPFEELWKFITHPPLCSPDTPVFIHPFFTESLLLGYECIAEEIIADLPELDAIVIPIGIGGLALAISRALKKLKPDVAIFTCESETAAPFKAALQNNKSIRIKTTQSFVDAIGTPEILPQIFNLLAPAVVDSEVVSLVDIQNALRMLLINNKVLCEGAAACSLAAAINIAKRTSYQNIVSILTGGNLASDYIHLNLP